MKSVVSVLLFVSLAYSQQLGHGSKYVRNLREDCVAAERLAVAVDANDFSHVKSSDSAAAGYCEGFIAGFVIGSRHAPVSSIRLVHKAIIAYIDDHPNEIDLRVIADAALKADASSTLP